MSTCRLGNRTLTYKHAIKPNRVEAHAADSAAADLQNQPYIVQVSQSEFKLISKASKDLVPQLVKLQQDTQAHERYLDPEVSDVVAVYMQQSDTLLAASDQVGCSPTVLQCNYVRKSTPLIHLTCAGSHSDCQAAAWCQAGKHISQSGQGTDSVERSAL